MRRLLLSLALLSLPASLAAQASQFGIRGLGQPGRWLSARAVAGAGAMAMFDPESALNPAALVEVERMTASFRGEQAWIGLDNPAGSGSLRDSRFPHMAIGTPVGGTRLWLGGGVSSYTNRDFSLASVSTVMLRGVPVEVFDTTSSRGGMTDLHAYVGTRLGARWQAGLGLHALTGSARVDARRAFGDSTFAPTAQRAELSYFGLGLSLGVIGHLSPRLSVAASLRSDDKARVDVDSTSAYDVDLPFTLGGAVRWSASPRLTLAANGVYRTWSGANSDLLQEGAPGTKNTVDLALGAEYIRSPSRPFSRPLRIGVRYAQLPNLLASGEQPSEVAVALGTGLRFAHQRGGIDLALERIWRTGGPEYRERVWALTAGVSVRP